MIQTKTLLFLLAVIVFETACAGAGNNNVNSSNANTAANSVQNATVSESPMSQMQNVNGDAKPPASPPKTAEAVFVSRKITVSYSSPSMRGRKIMGELVPFGKVWRTGANAATTLVTEADLNISGLSVPKGTYTLYTIPEKSGWKLIVSKQTGQWGTEYDEGQDLGRVNMRVKEVSPPVEMFAIALNKSNDKGGTLTMTWENTEASIPFTVEQ